MSAADNKATREQFNTLWTMRLNKTGDTWKTDALNEWWSAVDSGKDADTIIRAYALWSAAFRREQGKRYPGCYVPSLEKWLRGDGGTLLNEWYALANDSSAAAEMHGKWDTSRGLVLDNPVMCPGLLLGWYVPDAPRDAWCMAIESREDMTPDWMPLDEKAARMFQGIGLLGDFILREYRPYSEHPAMVACIETTTTQEPAPIPTQSQQEEMPTNEGETDANI